MNDDNTLISDYLNNLKMQSGTKEPDINTPETELNTNVCKSDKPSTETSVPVSNQPHQPESNTCESSVPNSNNNISVAQSALNLFSGLTQCVDKYVQIPGYPAYACTYFDNNYNAYLCVLNMQTNQPEPIAMIKFENSEYVVYQNGYRCGIITGNPYEQVWQFISDNMQIAQQPNHNMQTCISANTAANNIILENVPVDKVAETYNFINSFSSNTIKNIHISFADSPSQNNETDFSDSQDIIDIPVP